MSSCSNHISKFKLNECIKGDYLTFAVIREANWASYHYKLKIIAPENSIRFGDIIFFRDKIADKAFKKVSCEAKRDKSIIIYRAF